MGAVLRLLVTQSRHLEESTVLQMCTKIGFATVLAAAVVTWSSAWIGNPSLSGESQETD